MQVRPIAQMVTIQRVPRNPRNTLRWLRTRVRSSFKKQFPVLNVVYNTNTIRHATRYVYARDI